MPTVTIFFSQLILALAVFKKGLPKIMGQKSSYGVLRTRKSVGYFIFPHKTSTSLTVGGNDTYGVPGIPSTVGGREVVQRAGQTGSTRVVYPGSGCEDA